MKSVKLLARLSLFFIFLVILAGSIVRMTGSGMGCPDWPKCFGYIIPPTDDALLTWEPEREFKKGQMIIRNESLWVAQQDFVSAANFDLPNWGKYTKHNYAYFNATQTWIEYLNRLVGALSGLPVLLLVFMCFKHRKKSRGLLLLSLAALFMLGFEAWLGKKVVDGNLIPGQITIHMVGAVIIVILLLAISTKASEKLTWFPKKLLWILGAAISLSLAQIVLGSQVREVVDTLLSANMQRANVVTNIGHVFEWHRSLALVILMVNAFLIWKASAYSQSSHLKWMGAFLGLEILAGICLSYGGLISWMQPVHLVLALCLFTVQLHLAFSIRLGYTKQV